MNSIIDKSKATKEVNKIFNYITSPATLVIVWQFMKQSYDFISDVIGILKKYPHTMNDIIEIIIDSINESAVKIASKVNETPGLLNDLTLLGNKAMENETIISKLLSLNRTHENDEDDIPEEDY